MTLWVASVRYVFACTMFRYHTSAVAVTADSLELKVSCLGPMVRTLGAAQCARNLKKAAEQAEAFCLLSAKNTLKRA